MFVVQYLGCSRSWFSSGFFFSSFGRADLLTLHPSHLPLLLSLLIDISRILMKILGISAITSSYDSIRLTCVFSSSSRFFGKAFLLILTSLHFWVFCLSSPALKDSEVLPLLLLKNLIWWLCRWFEHDVYCWHLFWHTDHFWDHWDGYYAYNRIWKSTFRTILSSFFGIRFAAEDPSGTLNTNPTSTKTKKYEAASLVLSFLGVFFFYLLCLRHNIVRRFESSF